MASPDSDTYARLCALVAIDDRAGRPQQPVDEVFTGRHLAAIPVGDASDVAVAVERARKAQTAWAALPARQRAKVLHRFRDLVHRNRSFLMDVVQAETGKARSTAQEEVLDVAVNARYYATHGPELLAPRRVAGAAPGLVKAVVNHHPKGVVGVIAPWNYPMALSISDAIPALIAGNAVVIKPDSSTPYSTLAVAELLYEAGLPRDLLAVVPGPGSVVGTAIADLCDYLMFTGSTATGRVLAEQTGWRLIGYSAELGGKNPMIVTKDADIDVVAQAATRACFTNAGQLCLSIERIYVEAPVFDSFVDKLAARTRAMRLGASYGFDIDMGSLTGENQLKTVIDHVEDARSKGAIVVTGGRHRPDLGPVFYEPTVLIGVTDDMVCAREETFGPVVTVYPVADVEEAIARANDSEYGLNASVWAGSKAEGERIAARLRCGTVNVDEGYGPAYASTAAPMGGMGFSGLGRRHGAEGLLKYTETQTVATTRLINGDPPRGVPTALWQQSFPHIFRLVEKLPGR